MSDARFVCEDRGHSLFNASARYRVVDTENERRAVLCFTHLQETGDLICEALNFFMRKEISRE